MASVTNADTTNTDSTNDEPPRRMSLRKKSQTEKYLEYTKSLKEGGITSDSEEENGNGDENGQTKGEKKGEECIEKEDKEIAREDNEQEGKKEDTCENKDKEPVEKDENENRQAKGDKKEEDCIEKEDKEIAREDNEQEGKKEDSCENKDKEPVEKDNEQVVNKEKEDKEIPKKDNEQVDNNEKEDIDTTKKRDEPSEVRHEVEDTSEKDNEESSKEINQKQEKKETKKTDDERADEELKEASFHVPLTASISAHRSAAEIETNRQNALAKRRLREKHSEDATEDDKAARETGAPVKAVETHAKKDEDPATSREVAKTNDMVVGETGSEKTTTLELEDSIVEIEQDPEKMEELTIQQEMLSNVVSVLDALDDLDSILNCDTPEEIQDESCLQCETLTESLNQLEEEMKQKESKIDFLNTVLKAHETLLNNKKDEIDGMRKEMNSVLEKTKSESKICEIGEQNETQDLTERLKTVTKEKDECERKVRNLKKEVVNLHQLKMKAEESGKAFKEKEEERKREMERCLVKTKEVTEKNKRLEDELLRVKEDLEKKDEKLVSVSKELEKCKGLEEELIKANKELEKKEAKFLSVSKELEKVKHESMEKYEKSVSSKCETDKQLIEKLAESLKIVSKEKVEIEQKLIESQKQVEELGLTIEHNRKDIREKEDKLKKEVERSNSLMKKTNESDRKLEEEISRKNKIVANNQDRIESLKLELEEEKKARKETLNIEEQLLIAKSEISRKNHKLIESNDNMNEILTELRNRGTEIQQKEKEVLLLEKKISDAQATIDLMEENLQQLRDENTKTKNEVKLQKQNQGNMSPSQGDFKEFKKTVEKKFEELTKVIKELKDPRKKKESVANAGKQDSVRFSDNRHEEQESTTDDENSSSYPTRSSMKATRNRDVERVNIEISTDDEAITEGRGLKIIPGNHTYSEATTKKSTTSPPKEKDVIRGKKALIFSTSITKGIEVKRFNKGFEHGSARFQRWHGGEVEHIKTYVVSHLKKEKPDTVVLQMGGNDLHRGDRRNPATITAIANDIIEIALICRSHGVRHIFIGGVTVRRQQWTWDVCESLNESLEGQCTLHNFNFYSNNNITPHDLYDKVHLNDLGVRKMANNMLNCLCDYFAGNN